MVAETTAKKQQKAPRGKGFVKGESGNPQGRPTGARNRSTVAIETLLEGEAEAIARVCIERAKAGDAMALRLAMERVAPLRKGRPVRFEVAAMNGPGDLVKGLGSLLAAVANGTLTPDEAGTIASILETKRRAVETSEIVIRLAALEHEAEQKRMMRRAVVLNGACGSWRLCMAAERATWPSALRLAGRAFLRMIQPKRLETMPRAAAGLSIGLRRT